MRRPLTQKTAMLFFWKTQKPAYFRQKTRIFGIFVFNLAEYTEVISGENSDFGNFTKFVLFATREIGFECKKTEGTEPCARVIHRG